MYSEVEDEVKRALNGENEPETKFTPAQEQLLNDSRFLGTLVSTFFNTCINGGIPQPLTEGMTYMMMGRYMSVNTSVQGYGTMMGGNIHTG